MSAKEVQQALQEPETQVSSLGGDTDKAQLALERAQKKLHDFQMAHNAVVNQLARAHAQLQNVYLADKEPDVSFDVRKVGEWLIYLRNTLLTEVYEYVLKKTEELDAEGYGTKDQKESVSDMNSGGSSFDEQRMMHAYAMGEF